MKVTHIQTPGTVRFRIILCLAVSIGSFALGWFVSIEDTGVPPQREAAASPLGIHGQLNRGGNYGVINRLGQKAQNKPLAFLVGEAYKLEPGGSNNLFPDVRNQNHNCAVADEPAVDINSSDAADAQSHGFNKPLPGPSDWQMFTITKRSMDAPGQEPHRGAQGRQDQQVFSAAGCNLCHTPTRPSGGANNSANDIGGSQNGVVLVHRTTNQLFGLMLRSLRPVLPGNVAQAAAVSEKFREPQFLGVQQRALILHNGLNNGLLQTIQLHKAGDTGALGRSQANGVVNNSPRLEPTRSAGKPRFLRSL